MLKPSRSSPGGARSRLLKPLLALPQRGYAFARRVVQTAWHRAYARLVVVPYLTRHAGLGRARVERPAFSGVAIHDAKTFYKVALSARSTVEQEYRNWEEIRQRYPSLTAVLPDYRRNVGGTVRYLSMPSYRHPDAHESLAHAKGIFALMRTCGTTGRLQLRESQQLSTGLDVIGRLYGDAVHERVHAGIRTYLEAARYHLGFAHGDFHSRNILLDDHGQPRLVDLDCVRMQGIQELDALTFVLEMGWSRSGAFWHEQIGAYFKGAVPVEAQHVLERFGVEYTNGLGMTYLVDRVGQETEKYAVRYGTAQLDNAIEEILREPVDATKATRARTTWSKR